MSKREASDGLTYFPEKEVDVFRHTFNSSAAQTTVRLTFRPLRINICIGKHMSLAIGFN